MSVSWNPSNIQKLQRDVNLTENLRNASVAVMSGPRNYSDRGAIERMVSDALAALDLPADIVRTGDRVVLKPNWVKEHDERKPGPNQWEHVVTHPAVIEAVCRWVAKRLNGTGTITICDAPQTDSSFRKLNEYCGLDGIAERCGRDFPGVKVVVLDLRPEEWRAIDGVVVSKQKQEGDPLGSTKVSLNEASEFVDFGGQGKLYGASYDMAETNLKHAGKTHEYMLCRTPMEADVFINIPKLKTHKKVGVTCALKNSPALSTLFVPLKKAGRLYFGDTQKVVRSGNWHGNDTCWRMVLDLNKCLFFFAGDGQERKKPMRYLAVVDGIVGGEGNGPMSPDAKAAGVIVAGTHPAAVDVVAAAIMGFDWSKIRLLKNAFRMREKTFVPFGASDIRVVSNNSDWNGGLDELKNVHDFKPHFGWVGEIERKEGNSRVVISE